MASTQLEVVRFWWVWLVIQLVVVSWDMSYVLLRPFSMNVWLWQPYSLYAQIDYVYGIHPLTKEFNPFCAAQSWMNVVENFFYAVGLYFYRFRGDQNLGYIIWFGTLVATFSKTVLYAVLEVMDNSINVKHNDWFRFIFMYVIPNNVWTVVPGFFIFFVFGPAIYAHLNGGKKAAKKVVTKKEAVVVEPKSPRASSRSPRGRRKQE